jgi:predicted PurR-regulated permease PerM
MTFLELIVSVAVGIVGWAVASLLGASKPKVWGWLAFAAAFLTALFGTWSL